MNSDKFKEIWNKLCPHITLWGASKELQDELIKFGQGKPSKFDRIKERIAAARLAGFEAGKQFKENLVK